MAFYSIFQEAFTASTSACDVGQEMLHATLLLSCAFVGWCASSSLIGDPGWFQNRPHKGKAKEGSSIFREEVAAYVQANTIEDATRHFGLSPDEIRNCIDAVRESQKEAAQWKVGHIWQLLHDVMMGKVIEEARSLQAVEAGCEPIEACEDVCTFSIAPTIAPGMALLEQYGVFGAASGTWSGPQAVLPIPKHLQSDTDNSLSEDQTENKEELDELANQVPPKKVQDTNATSFACSHGYGMPADYLHNGSGQYCHNAQGRVWVPLEYTW